jgi:hypothetical protein
MFLDLAFIFVILISSVFGVELEYELLAYQLASADLFTSDVSSQVIGVEGADLYSKIGAIPDPRIYLDAAGRYRFKLIYSPTDNSGEQVIEFYQTSWITSSPSSLTGFTAINIPALTGGNDDDCSDFDGLAISTSDSSCYIDGAVSSGCWWNCVGALSLHSYDGYTGMPGYDRMVASKMQLFVLVPACDVLDIDEYLTECSDEFDAVGDNANAIRTLQRKVRALEQAAPRAQVAPNNNILSNVGSESMSTVNSYENYIILLSLLLNVILISFACIIFKKVNKMDNRYKYGKVRSYVESDADQPLQT